MNIAEIFQYAFIQRALIAGVIIGIFCSTWGIFLILKKQSYLPDAVAHSSLAGIAAALAIGIDTFVPAILTAVVLAISITYIKHNTKLNFDTIIVIIYTLLFAAGVMIISLFPSYKSDLFSYLFGSILSVGTGNIIFSLIFLVVSLLILKINYKKLLYSAFDPEGSFIRGINFKKYEYMINIFTSIAIIIAIKMVGIILVSALMIIPPAIGKNISRNFKSLLYVSSISSVAGIISGVILSVFLNLPAGPVIVIILALLFIISLINKK